MLATTLLQIIGAFLLSCASAGPVQLAFVNPDARVISSVSRGEKSQKDALVNSVVKSLKVSGDSPFLFSSKNPVLSLLQTRPKQIKLGAGHHGFLERFRSEALGALEQEFASDYDGTTLQGMAPQAKAMQEIEEPAAPTNEGDLLGEGVLGEDADSELEDSDDDFEQPPSLPSFQKKDPDRKTMFHKESQPS